MKRAEFDSNVAVLLNDIQGEIDNLSKPKRKSSDRMVISSSKFELFMKRFFVFYAVSIVIVVLLAGICSYNLGKKQVSFLSYKSVTTHTVKGGESLWTIAEEISDGSQDIRRIVYEIQDINNMKSLTIYPYDELIIPVFN